MLLSDIDISRAIQNGQLTIDPLPEVIQPSSVDLTLGPNLKVARGVQNSPVYPTRANDHLWNEVSLPGRRELVSGHYQPEDFVYAAHSYVMPPGAFVLGHTAEKVTLGRSVAAYIDGRSTLARNGLSVHVTAGFIDPGFSGQITLELQNVAPWPLVLSLGMPIGQLVLHRMSTMVHRAYGDKVLGSKYQGQDGATLARDPIS